jgi:hypothetical protein
MVLRGLFIYDLCQGTECIQVSLVWMSDELQTEGRYSTYILAGRREDVYQHFTLEIMLYSDDIGVRKNIAVKDPPTCTEPRI